MKSFRQNFGDPVTMLLNKLLLSPYCVLGIMVVVLVKLDQISTLGAFKRHLVLGQGSNQNHNME